MDEPLFIQFLVGSTFALISYLPLATIDSDETVRRLWTMYYETGSNLRRVWYISFALTAASFLYIQYFLQITPHDRQLTMGIQSAFLMSASQWMGLAVAGAMTRPSSVDDDASMLKRFAIANVCVTAAVSIAYLVYFSVYHSNAMAAIACSSMLVVHHVFLDGWWARGFSAL